MAEVSVEHSAEEMQGRSQVGEVAAREEGDDRDGAFSAYRGEHCLRLLFHWLQIMQTVTRSVRSSFTCVKRAGLYILLRLESVDEMFGKRSMHVACKVIE
jgi:hypothetical protein